MVPQKGKTSNSVYLVFLLLLSGDVELNPGPGDPRDILRKKSATLTGAISNNLNKVAVSLYAKRLIPQQTVEDTLIAAYNDDKKAGILVGVLQSQLHSIYDRRRRQYLIKVCNFLKDLGDETLATHANDMLKELDGALRKWGKEGSVDLTVTRVNMLGVPGSGKTCAQLMLLDEDPPTKKVNDSTEIACPTVRAVRVAADDESMKWKRITRDELLGGLAADLTEASLEKTEASSSGTEAVSPESKQIQDDVDFHAEEVVQEILANDLPDIRLKGHWLYVIDSGGQPAYQELLPLFTRAASLNIITLDLSKPFDEEFDMMYRIDRKYFRCRSKSTQLASFQSTVSTAANFKSLDISCVTKPHRHSMHLVLGTHYDKVDEAILKAYDDALISSISSLQPYLKVRIIKKSKNSIIFPVNTVDESKEERDKYRKEVCQAIWDDGSDASVTIKIPIRWFAFELLLPEKRSIISFEEAESIGRRCGMKKEDTIEALQYFHDVSLMLYYPDVIRHVVFLDPKPILKILSQLLALTYEHVDDENTHDHIKTLDDSKLRKFISPLQLSKTDIENLKDGFFHEEIFTFLKSKSEIFSHSEFQIPELISLLLHLNIIIKVKGNEKGSYFIPYALPSYCGSVSHLTVEESDVRSLLIVWREKNKSLPVPQGLFPLALMHLLNQKELGIDLFSSIKSKYFKFRDAMSIQITYEEISHTLHLINHYTHIEIAFIGHQEHCSKIREVVMKAIDKATDDLHMECNYTNAFACPNDLKECYCLVVNKDKFIVKCTDCSTPALMTEDNKCWFKSSTNAPHNTSVVPPAPLLKKQGNTQISPSLKKQEKIDEASSSSQKYLDKWSKLGMTCVFGLLILFALAGYLAFCWYSILGVAIYGLVLLVALAGYLVFIQGQVFYGLVVLGLTLLVSAEIFSIWNSILRIMIRGAFIAVFFWTGIVIWNNEGDFTKVQPLLLALVTAFLTQVVSQFLKNSSDSDK